MGGEVRTDAADLPVRQRLALHGAALVVTALVLAPAVRPGYLLRYDMVFVPRQPLRADLIASADTLPRAVPQDLVVSLASLVVPGWLLQWIVLVAISWLAAVGAGRLVPARRTLTRLVAAVGYAWTPFLAERLLLGQWGLLLAYAALPWLVAAALRLREGRPGGLPRLVVAAAVSAIIPTGGVIALLTTVALVIPVSWPTLTVLRRDLAGAGRGAGAVAVGAVLALNAPWVAAALATSAGGRSDPDGVAAFAARAENWAGPWVALAGTGGIWNAYTTPVSRASALVPAATLALLALGVAGFPVLRRRWPAGLAMRFGGLAAVAFLLGAAGTLPGGGPVLRWLVAEVPGAGLLRDGQKFLIPYAGLLVLCAALGAERLAARLPRPGDRLVLVGLLLLPAAVLPDLAFGAAGRLHPVRYPDDWRVVATTVRDDPGPVLSLPLSMYRAYPWNRDTVVIDPLPRYLPVEVLTDDTLLVDDLVVAGENARMARIRELVAAGAPIAGTGVRWVVVQRGTGGDLPDGVLTGLRPVYEGPALSLYADPAAGEGASEAVTGQPGWWLALLGAALAAAVLLAAVGCLFRKPTAW